MVTRIALIMALLGATGPAAAELSATAQPIAVSALAGSASSAALPLSPASKSLAQPITYTVAALALQDNFSRNHPVEDFFVVSLVSVPFVALWTLVGAAAVAGISQKKFPPEFSDATLISTAAVALGTSISIGLASVYWGRGVAPHSEAGR